MARPRTRTEMAAPPSAPGFEPRRGAAAPPPALSLADAPARPASLPDPPQPATDTPAHALADAAPPPPGLADPTLAELEQLLVADHSPPRWMGWRLHILLVTVLLACTGLFGVARWAAQQPHLDAAWKPAADGQIRLAGTSTPALRPAVGAYLLAIGRGAEPAVRADPVMLLGSLRWISDDGQRRLHTTLRQGLAAPAGAAAAPPLLTLSFSNGVAAQVQAVPRGLTGLAPLFWLLSGFALVLAVAAVVVALAGAPVLNPAYAALALAQSASLLLIALESTFDMTMPVWLSAWDWHLRSTLDLASAACVVQIAATTPRRLPGHHAIVAAGWLLAATVAVLCWPVEAHAAWWWLQAGCGLMGLAGIALMSWSYLRDPHPYTMVLRRFSTIGVGTWLLLSVAIAVSDGEPDLRHGVVTVGAMIWYVFLASLTLLVPYLTRSQQALREFSLLAATSTVATSLDLLFVAVFSFGQFTSVTLALALSLGVYLAARQWLVSRVLGSNRLTMEQLFERLYRMARELELHPQRTTALLTRLLRELFEPLEVHPLPQAPEVSAVLANGSALVVPLGRLATPGSDQAACLLVRHAHRGQRLFSSEDARLTDRILDQIHRAVAFAQAVEQGRVEERLRIAQDLHDDIGARLLTLMYQAPSPEIEEYIRHTLQDLKTLTRGLASQSHRLSDAAAEWKADIAQRLDLAHCRLHWALTFDHDVELGIVQWSALTRILRELVNNVIAHAAASEVWVEIRLEGDGLDLSVADNGHGTLPHTWRHGLGLGGVRKRVKQLAGQVEWRQHEPRGVVCHVRVPSLSATA